jgi:6-phosphogluconate dehydrogenase
MNIGVIGLGKMGLSIAQRMHNNGHKVLGYDPKQEVSDQAAHYGIRLATSSTQLAHEVDIVWIMVPAGPIVDDIITEINPALHKGTIIIDGGNSFFRDSIRRAHTLQAADIAFLDCGTSGGVHGFEHGFCLMVGGIVDAYTQAFPVLQAVAAPDGVAHVGPSGAGHYVKMVHNGIEYGLLQAYAEGFHVLKEGDYPDLDLHQIAALWNTSAVIRSFLLTLVTNVFTHGQTFKTIIGTVAQTGTGQWTVDNAHQHHIPVDVIEAALHIRLQSQATGGNYATKLVALLREQFGGHSVKKEQNISE